MISKESKPLAETLMKGAGWAIGIRWVSKLLGVVSLAICARVLLPEDYGLVSMAMVVVGFASILVEFGLDAALVRNPEATAEHFDTAWTLRVIQGLIISTIIVAAIPVAVRIFGDPRVAPVMLAVALSGLVGGFQNIYVVNFLKTLNFRQDFLFSTAPRLLSFAATVSAVLWLESYWGLIVGQAVNDVSRAVLSYLVCPERPRWTLVRWRQIGGFSIWYFGAGVANFLTFQLDRVVVGALGGTKMTGLFVLSREVAALPNSELVEPIGRALLPTLAHLHGDKARQAAAVQRAFAGIILITVPLSIGLALVADEFIRVFLGPNWGEAAPVVALLSLVGLSAGYRATARNVLITLGKVRANAAIAWAQALFTVILLYPAYQQGALQGVAWVHIACGFVAMGLLSRYLHRMEVYPFADQIRQLSRPYLAGLVMYLVVKWLEPAMALGIVPLLIAKVALGSLVYSLAIVSLWLLAGQPESIERKVVRKILGLAKAKRQEKAPARLEQSDDDR